MTNRLEAMETPLVEDQVLPDWGTDEDKLRQLPTWSYHKQVKELASCDRVRSAMKGGPLPLTCTTGPAVKWGFLGLASYWSFVIVMPYLAYLKSSCPSTLDSRGFAVCDDALLWGLFALMVLGAIFIQYKCMSYIIPSQLAVTKKFYWFECILFNRFPYAVFATAMSTLLVLALLDAMTNAEILGKAWKTRECHSYQEISHVWDKTLKESVFVRHLPWFIKDLDFAQFVLLAYCFLFLQPLYALINCIPIECGVDYAVGFNSPERTYKFEYNTVYWQRVKTNHGAVLMFLAEACRFEGVVFQDFTYARCKMQDWAEKRIGNWQQRYCNLAHVEMVRAMFRFVQTSIFQNGLQLNVQITLMAITYEATGLLDPSMVFSVVVMILSSLTDLPDMHAFVFLVYSVEIERADMLATIEDISEDTETNNRYKAAVNHELSSMRCLRLRFLIYALIYIYMIVWAACKLYGCFACKHHLWNWGTGCVVLHGVSA
eukprot:TRINITY_DN65247_c0_g1_i1.p1 TRINITY_DN65247_c0_g1~~TRINITY_DN65247_c0_g1_i1.p1  ORF type:complete len:487 (+),score=54.02 TRINITY_DN65247_c0_g1_i1:49-1509(+)